MNKCVRLCVCVCEQVCHTLCCNDSSCCRRHKHDSSSGRSNIPSAVEARFKLRCIEQYSSCCRSMVPAAEEAMVPAFVEACCNCCRGKL